MKNLRLKMNRMSSGMSAVAFIESLGIKYQLAVPQTICDQWWFWCCENVPNELPACLEELKITPTDAVGNGLSKTQAEYLDNYKR